MRNFKLFLVVVITILGLGWRLYHIEFGLPHSFHADEPEIAELAIKYTFELKDIVKNNSYYKLVPVSYVYGTFPAYFFTAVTMLYSKTNNLLGNTFSKTDLYIFMRSVNALLAFVIAPLSVVLYYKLFKDKFGTVFVFFLTALNWKLIVHAHYINADIMLTVILSALYLVAYFYFCSVTPNTKTKYTILLGLLFGLAVGTKITATLILPLFVFLYIRKKDYLGLLGLLLVALATFMVTNPFSVIFYRDFIFRMYQLQFRENGLVFDSADLSVTKYIFALGFIATPLILAASLYGKWTLIKNKVIESKDYHIFLAGNVFMYLVFFTLGSRKVDRWLLPILPIVLIYGVYGISQMRNYLLTTVTGGAYLVFPILLLLQFQQQTPKSAAYLWMQQNTLGLATKYVVTEEGLDPMNKLPLASVHQFEVYESKGAQLAYPPNPLLYDYVVLSSKPMDYYKNSIVQKRFPNYFERWNNFEKTVMDPNQFELIQEYVLPKPNLVNLSDVYIYKKLH